MTPQTFDELYDMLLSLDGAEAIRERLRSLAAEGASKESLQLHSNLLLELRGPDGALKDRREIHNIICTLGKNKILDSAGTSKYLKDFAYVVIGSSISTTVTTGATSATQTVGSTTGMVAGQSHHFATAAVDRIVSSVTNGTTVVYTASVTSTTGEAVTSNAIAGDTALANELARAASTVSNPTSASLQMQYTFPAGTGTGTVRESSLDYQNSASGNILARQVFGDIVKGASDTLQITWTIS